MVTVSSLAFRLGAVLGLLTNSRRLTHEIYEVIGEASAKFYDDTLYTEDEVRGLEDLVISLETFCSVSSRTVEAKVEDFKPVK